MLVADPPLWPICIMDNEDGCYNFIYDAYIPFPSNQSESWCIVTDPRVMYSEPAKFVAKLRDLKADDNLLLFKCEFGAGHDSKSGR